MQRIAFVLLIGFLAAAVPAVHGQEVLLQTSGFLTARTEDGPGGDAGNTFRVRVEAGSLIEAVAASDDVDTWVDVILPDGTTFSNDDYVGLDAGFVRIMPETGQLSITVSALYGEPGEFELVVSRLSAGQTLNVGDRISATLGKTAHDGRRFADIYHLSGNAGEWVNIDLISPDFDAFLEVVDDRGNTYFDDDGGSDLNSRLAYRFEDAGSLIITATSVMGDATGSYVLRITPFERTVVMRHDDRLEPDGRRTYDGRLYRMYQMEGRAGRSVGILLESGDFDPILYLSREDGRHLAMDDDGGGGLNSLLDVVLPADEVYQIFALSLHPDEAGDYRLTVFE
jgi:hypothetical protein